MRIFGFGTPRAASRGVLADYSLHLQCPWRVDGPTGTLVASGDLYEYGGPGPEPENWHYEQGNSLQAVALEALLGPRIPLGTAHFYRSELVVDSITMNASTGDLLVTFGAEKTLSVFTLGKTTEQWRFFAPTQERDHFVYGDS